jgi:RNA recognition motif-containing protein
MEIFMSQKIYVGNLSFKVTDTTLMDKFAEFGSVVSSKLIIDRDTNRSKGFAFVEMSSPTEAARAISVLNGQELDGRNMNVSEAKELAPKPRSTNRW